MKIKKLLLLLVILFFGNKIFAQQETRLLYTDKKVIYSKLNGQEGRNINLSLLIYTNDTIKLIVSCYNNNNILNTPDTLLINQLSFLPVQNLIITNLKTHSVGANGQTAIDILESQSISTIDLMVLAGQTFLTSLNTVDRNNITSSFAFKIKVPIFIKAESATIEKLFKVVTYKINPEQKITPYENDTSTLRKRKDSVERILSNKEITQTESKDTLSKLLSDIKEDYAQAQNMTGSNKDKYFLVGYAFVEKNEIVINNGFVRAMKVTFNDSMELRYRFGGNKISLNKVNIDKISEYNFSIDLRSVSFSQKSLKRYLAVWSLTNHNGDLQYWTYFPKLFSYDPPEDSTITDLFVTRKQRIIFNAKNPVVIRIKETDINSVIQLNLFTDLVGIQEDQPNGLVQAEGTFKTHLFGLTSQKRFQLNRISILDNLEANLKFSKIENKLRYLDAGIIKGGPKVTFIPSFQILQYQNLEAGIKTSIFKVESYKREFNFYASAEIIRTGLRDTTYQINNFDTTKIPRSYNILSFKKSIQSHLKIKATSYVGVDISAEFIWLTLLDKDVKQSGGNYSRETNSYEKFKPKQNIIFSPQFQVYYLPDRDESKRLYLRGAFYHDLGTKSNSFLAIQVGLSSDINKFLNFK